MPQIFPVGTRQPGVLESPDKVVPAGAAGHTYLVQTVIAQADLDDPTVSFSLQMFIKNGGVYPSNPDAAVAFQGGPNQGKGGAVTPQPGWDQPGDEVANQTVKFVLNVTGRAFDAGLNADPL